MGQDLNLGNGMGNEKNLEITYSSLFCSTISTVTCVSSVEQWKSLPAGGSESCRKMKLNKTVLSAVSFCQIKNGRLKWDGLGIVLQTGKWDISKPFREMDGKWAEWKWANTGVKHHRPVRGLLRNSMSAQVANSQSQQLNFSRTSWPILSKCEHQRLH